MTLEIIGVIETGLKSEGSREGELPLGNGVKLAVLIMLHYRETK